MNNLKQFVLVSAYLIALLLPLWHGAEALNYAWKLGEEWLREKPVTDCAAGGCVTMGTLTTSGGTGTVTMSDASCQAGQMVALGNGNYAIATVCTNATGSTEMVEPDGTVVTYRVGVMSQSTGGTRSALGITGMTTTHFKHADDPDSDGWPNERDCPFDKDKGARVCKGQ